MAYHSTFEYSLSYAIEAHWVMPDPLTSLWHNHTPNPRKPTSYNPPTTQTTMLKTINPLSILEQQQPQQRRSSYDTDDDTEDDDLKTINPLSISEQQWPQQRRCWRRQLQGTTKTMLMIPTKNASQLHTTTTTTILLRHRRRCWRWRHEDDQSSLPNLTQQSANVKEMGSNRFPLALPWWAVLMSSK